MPLYRYNNKKAGLSLTGSQVKQAGQTGDMEDLEDLEKEEDDLEKEEIPSPSNNPE